MSSSTMPPSRPPEAYWLIVKSGAGQTQVLTVDPDGLGEALAVFGFEEEATIFSLGELLGAGWRLRKTTAGELIRLLLGPCASVGFIALDPLPEVISRGMVGLVSLSRKRFVDHLIEREESLISRAGEGTFIQEASDPEVKPARCPRASHEVTLSPPGTAGEDISSTLEKNGCRHSRASGGLRCGGISRSNLGGGAKPRRRPESDAQSS